jgi:enolase-phosphatase E1
MQSAIKYILSDIEGTTTPITFVHDVLFPYAYEKLPSFVARHAHLPDVQKCLADTAATVRQEEGRQIANDEAVQVLLGWIKADRKHPALKTLQGLIWVDGYQSGAYQAEVYPDVIPSIKAWLKAGKKVGIYSSGSVQAQKLLFGHTPEGNINPLLSDYFDTAVGGKKESASYTAIAKALGLAPATVVFLSDVEAELVAADQAGMRVIQLVRPGTTPTTRFPTATDFTQVSALLS